MSKTIYRLCRTLKHTSNDCMFMSHFVLCVSIDDRETFTYLFAIKKDKENVCRRVWPGERGIHVLTCIYLR